MPVTPTWFDRDLPVLEASITLLEERFGGQVQFQDVAERCGLEPTKVFSALLAMEGTYVELTVLDTNQPEPHMVTGVTSAARVAVGQWPSPETLTDRLIAALEAAVEHETDPVRKKKLRAVADAVARIGRDILVNVVSAAATGAIGLH